MISPVELYKRLPNGVRIGFKSIYGVIPLQWRLTKAFKTELAFLENSQWWSRSKLEEYQNAQLRKLIEHAYRNVPYYQRLFEKNKIRPRDIQGVEDLIKIPILKKDDVRKHYEELKAKNYGPKDIMTVATSGTTGKPLQIVYDKSREYLNYDPFVWRFFEWGGHHMNELRATISNWTLPDGQIHSLNRVRNILILSAYKMNLNTVEAYADALQRYNIQFLDGFPSSLELLVNFLKTKKIKPPISLKAIFCYAEYLTDWQRRMIEDYWGCRCFNRYSHEERTILAMECDQHQGLHLNPDYGITEFVKSDVEGFFWMIATSLTNYAMPLIRYDTEDLGRLRQESCPCGRNFPLIELRGGRKKNFALAKDNSYIPIANIDIPNVSENVVQFQFIQERKGHLILKIIKKDSFQETDLQNIKTKLKEKFDDNMTVDIHFTDQLEKNKKNKTPLFIQKIPEVTSDGDD